MSSVRIVTDSGADLPDDLVQQWGISVVPLTIRFGDEEFLDRVTLSSADFWARCARATTLPSTAAPSPAAFQAVYDEAAQAGGDGVLVITLSAALSGTYQSALVAAATTSSTLPIRVIDSATASWGQGLLVLELATAAAGGVGLDELVARAEADRSRIGVMAMISTLDHLIKGGRIGGAKAFIGQILSIKPLVALRNGVVEEAGRQRTTSKALRALADHVRAQGPLQRLAIMGGDSPDEVALAALTRDIPCVYPLVMGSVGPTVGTHGGPGIIGVAWLVAGAPLERH